MNDSFLLRETDGLVTAFRADGKVHYVEDINGNRITAGYTGARISSLNHSSGQILQIAYNGAGRIGSVTDPASGRQATFTYDPSGKCVRIPTQETIPPNARVRSYPVVERHKLVWIWMGDPALADESAIEDFHWLDDPGWRFKGERLELPGNYLLLVENLCDLTHLPFVHASSLGTTAIHLTDCWLPRPSKRQCRSSVQTNNSTPME